MGMTSEEWLAAGILLASMAIIVLAVTFLLTRWLRPRSAPPAAWQSVLIGAGTAGVLFVFGYVLLDMQRALWSAPALGLWVGAGHYFWHRRVGASTEGGPNTDEPAGARRSEPS